MSLIIHGELDAISGDAAGLQAVSDKQAAAMQRMASTLEAAASALQSPGAGASLVGDPVGDAKSAAPASRSFTRPSPPQPITTTGNASSASASASTPESAPRRSRTGQTGRP